MTAKQLREAARMKFMIAFGRKNPMVSSIMRSFVEAAFLAGWDAARRSPRSRPSEKKA